MGERQKDGKTKREHLEFVAGKVASAAAELEEPALPEAGEYLVRWLQELHGRSGIDMAGVSPLAYGTIRDWARLTGRRPTPQDVEALVLLDSVMRHPDEAK